MSAPAAKTTERRAGPERHGGTVAADLGALLTELEVAFREVAETALARPDVAVEGHGDEPEQGQQGAYLALVAPAGALQIGIASDEAGCQALAKGLMGMGEADPALSPPEMADAFCEIVNIVAGGFKGRIREKVGSLTMGLPVFFHGPAQPTEHTAVRVARLRAGGVAVALLLVFPRAHAEG
ncbi:MAG TPA: chemotaxis protein CheX [Anaeromyxobacter sp.]|nr:chemotaxis protein CheX [Anaeromyxobacter sp.]